jgi:hypothetical protein
MIPTDPKLIPADLASATQPAPVECAAYPTCRRTSRSTRIQEVENADESDEREKPAGQDNGFMWRLYSYWRFEERDGGVHIECESVSLSRSIHWSVAWFVRPFVTGLPKEPQESNLGSLRSALVARAATPRPDLRKSHTLP